MVAVEPRSEQIQRRALVVLAAGAVFGGVGVATGIAVSSLVAAELSGSDVVGGAALTVMVVGTALTAYPLARLATRRGRRPALGLGYLIGAVGALVAALGAGTGNAALLLVAMLPFGASTAAGLAARFAATDLAPERARARALAVVIFAGTVGAVSGPNIAAPAELLAQRLGWVPGIGPFLLCAVAFGLAWVVTVVALRPDPLLLAREIEAGAGAASGADAGSGSAAGAGSGAGGGAGSGAGVGAWRAVRAAPLAQLAIAGIVVCHLVMVGVMSMTPVHMNHGGATLSLVGFVISLHVAGMYALSPLFGILADRLGPIPVLTLGAALLVGACVLSGMAGGHQAGLLAAGLIALGLGWSAGLVAGSVLLTNAVPLADRAGAQGLSDVAMNVSGAVGGIAAGLTVAVTSYAVLGFAAAAIVVPFLAALLFAAPRQRHA